MLSSRAMALGLILVATQSIASPAPESADLATVSWRARLDAWHDWLYLGVQRELRDFDARLVGEGSDPVEVNSPFRLEVDLAGFAREGEADFRGATRFDIDLQLPNLERRLRLFLTTDDLSETVPGAPQDLRGGVRVGAFPGADFEIGIKIDAPPVAFAALRWGEEYRYGKWSIHPFAKIFIDSSQGPGLGTTWVLDRWQEQTFWRSSTSVLGLPRRSTVAWTQSLVWARTTDVLSEGRPLARIGSRDIVHGWGVELVVSGEESRIEQQEIALFFKRPLQSDWLFVSVRPFWRSSRVAEVGGSWTQEMGVSLGLDMLFWGPAGQGRTALN